MALAALWLAAFAGMGSGAAAEPLLETTRGLFARGRFVIGALVVQRGVAILDDSPTDADLDRVLLDSKLETLAVWLLNSSGAEIRIAERQAAQGRRNPRISRQLGIRALSRRNWARAAEHFDRVLEAHPRFARIRQLSRFATCMADPSRTAAQACSLAREAGSEEPGS